MIHANIWELSNRLMNEKNQTFKRYYDFEMRDKGRGFCFLGHEVLVKQR